jgi:hypothetical protein
MYTGSLNHHQKGDTGSANAQATVMFSLGIPGSACPPVAVVLRPVLMCLRRPSAHSVA